MVTVVGGTSVGGEFGKAFGDMLQTFAQQKMQKVQQRQHATGLQALGIPAEAANQIVMLPPEIQGIVVKNFLAGAENQGLNQALSELLGQPSPQGTQLLQVQPKQINGQTVNPIYSKIPQNHPAYVQNNLPEPVQQQEGKSFAEILKNPRLKPEHRLQIAKLQQQKQLQEQKLTATEQKEANKETKPVYDRISKEYKASKDSEKRLGRMRELIKKGNLPNSAWASALKTLSKGIWGFGVDLGFLTHADAQEFNKLSKDFLKNAKDYFGARLTDTDLNTFLQTVPDLSQTDEGKLRVINNLESFDKAADLRYKTMKNIIKENGGRRPANLEELIDERISPELDNLAKQFKQGSESQDQENLLMKALRSVVQI